MPHPRYFCAWHELAGFVEREDLPDVVLDALVVSLDLLRDHVIANDRAAFLAAAEIFACGEAGALGSTLESTFCARVDDAVDLVDALSAANKDESSQLLAKIARRRRRR